jgi:hypothetical protein
MANKNNAIYAPGELSKVRDKLGVTDEAEAKRMALLLGGEVGTERAAEEERKKGGDVFGGRKRRSIDLAPEDEEELAGIASFKSKKSGPYPGDDPSVPAKLGYRERVKIDQYAGQTVFEIKNPVQVLTSIFSFFKEPVDYVNYRFVINRMNEYYSRIERLVNAARSLFPKNNQKRNNQLKRASIFVYKVLDVIRSWDIEALAKNIAELQSHPRSVRVHDFSEVLRGVYRPLFIIEELSMENIKSAFKLIYKVLYIESPMEAKDKYQEVIRNIISSISEIRRNVHFGMYPLLMKLISDRFMTYERFFIERRRRFMAFLNTKETEQLNAVDLSPQQIESIDVDALQKNMKEEEISGEEAANGEVGELLEVGKETPEDPKAAALRAKQEAEKAERRSMEQGKSALEVLFPKAGWDKLEEYPDFYPYFANVYNLRHGYELISPTDPLQYISVLLHILDDLFIGMRYVNFGTVMGPDGSSIKIGDELTEIINNWRGYIEDSFSRDYLPRLTEYCRMLENSKESRMTPYGRKNLNELHWIKRLYFLPYYKFESVGPPPFPKSEIVPIYSEVRKVRKYLTAVALGIEQGMHSGGAKSKTPCRGINNPWENYNFQVPNPVSRRLDMMLPSERKINATLIFFSLSAATVLDYIINNENSWVYNSTAKPGPLFRSIKNEGMEPQFGVDNKLDADKIFRESLRKQQQQQQKQNA